MKSYLDSGKVLKNKLIFSSIEITKQEFLKFLIPKTVWEVITGELLGDGHISYDPVNKPLINGRLEFTFAATILHYVNHLKFNVLSPICTTSNPTPWPKGQQPLQYWFSTKRLSILTNLYFVWYKEIQGKYIKVLPYNIESLLTPIGLAHFKSPKSTLFFKGVRTYSTYIPSIKKYENADILKLQAVSENKGKSGVYRWINNVNGKTYIGSSINLGKRLGNYFNLNYISTSKMLISKALIKYGYSNFSLEIIEYCDRSDAILREQYYLDICKPEYNLLKVAGSSLGYVHTENTIAKMRDSRFNWTEEQKTKVLDHLKIHNSSADQIEKSRQRLIEYNKSKGVSIEILDTKTNEVSTYSSIRQAAETIGCVHRTILLAERSLKERGISRLIKKRYLVKPMRREFHSFTRSSAQAISNNKVWTGGFMGDGYFTNGSTKICTDNFTKEEVLKLIDVLEKNFSIKATINKRTNPNGAIKWRINISKLSMNTLISLVELYVIPEMFYKLGLKKYNNK